MNDNDLRDEAAAEYYEWKLEYSLTTEAANVHARDVAMAMWKECRRRAEANPWQFLSEQDLETLHELLDADWQQTPFEMSYDPNAHLTASIQAELNRRKEAK